MPIQSHRGTASTAFRVAAAFGFGRDCLGHDDFPVWVVAGAQQKPLEAFDEFITAGQMRPAALEIEQFRLHCGIGCVLGALLAVGCASITRRNMLTEFLKHHMATV